MGSEMCIRDRVRCVRIEEEGGTLTVVRGPRPSKLYATALLWLLATVLQVLLASFTVRWSCLHVVDEYAMELAQLEQEESVSPSAQLEAEIADMKDDPPRCFAGRQCLCPRRSSHRKALMMIPSHLGPTFSCLSGPRSR